MTSSLLPAEFNTVTLTGQYVNLDGTAVAGYLTFTPSPTILRAALSKDLIVPVVINVPLDGTGSFAIPLPATDDPDINPEGWTYQVLEGFGNRRTYSVQILLAGGTTQNIFDLAPVAMANGTYYELGPTGPAGPPALITTGAPAGPVGSTGDYAIDPVAGVLYGPKNQSTGWPAGVHLAATDIAAHAALTRSHGIQSGSALVGTTDTQTLSNKTLSAPVVTGGLSTNSATVSGATTTATLSVTGAATLPTVTGPVAVTGNVGVTGTLSATGAVSGAGATFSGQLNAAGAVLTGNLSMPSYDINAHTVTANLLAATNATVSATPVAGTDVANKSYVDTKAAGSVTAVANTVVARDANGRTQMAEPGANADVATKNYVDNTAGDATGLASALVRRDSSGTVVGAILRATSYASLTGVATAPGASTTGNGRLYTLASDYNLYFVKNNGTPEKLTGNDTGWVNLTINGGFATLTSNPGVDAVASARIKNGILHLRGGFSNTGMAASGTYTVANLPASFFPLTENYFGYVGSSSLAAGGLMQITGSTGAIKISTPATLGTYYKLTGVSCPID